MVTAGGDTRLKAAQKSMPHLLPNVLTTAALALVVSMSMAVALKVKLLSTNNATLDVLPTSKTETDMIYKTDGIKPSNMIYIDN